MKVAWTEIIWNSYITPKHAFILLLGARSKLLTKDKLKHLNIDRRYIFCGVDEETECHLFFSCPISFAILGHVRDWLGIRRSMSTRPSALKWIKKEVQWTTWHSKAKWIALASTIYHLWMACNRDIFEDLTPNVEGIVRKIKTHNFSRVCRCTGR
ncbi:uncharacterized protein LOC111374897 [Olea europaea var. sylvestris]|uniref:uncharacterized protein LOC111374897 n=1 Tax=Olea europaea var. sylvestris TaxID=158386 RepID=UPI000C1D0F87|nr:uncharacterized protein LOC111374897 [Olea europaea var. sylvestris]